MAADDSGRGDCPRAVDEWASRAVEYVQRALALELSWDSETLPIADHWLQSVPSDNRSAFALAACTGGCYFGEVVRRRLGGHWDISAASPDGWRLELPCGVWLLPAGMAAAAIVQGDAEGWDDGLHASPPLLPQLRRTLEGMGAVSEEAYYSLGGRLDTLEQVHHVFSLLQQREKD